MCYGCFEKPAKRGSVPDCWQRLGTGRAAAATAAAESGQCISSSQLLLPLLPASLMQACALPARLPLPPPSGGRRRLRRATPLCVWLLRPLPPRLLRLPALLTLTAEALA